MRRNTTTRILSLLVCFGPLCAGLAAERQESPADLQFEYAEGLYLDGLRKLATAEWGKFLKLYKNDPRAPQAHFYLGECYYVARSYKTALPHFEAATRDTKRSYHPVALYRIGDCRSRLGDIKGAIKPLQQFLTTKLLSPDHRQFIVHAKYSLARAQFAQRNLREALRLFREVLADPSPANTYKPYVLLPIGDCLAALGEPDEALASYRDFEEQLVAAIKKNPEASTAKADREMLHDLRVKIASLLLARKRYQDALAVFGRLGDTGRFPEEILYGRAQALFFLQRYQEALVPARQYLKRFSKGKLVLSVLYIIGESHYRTNQFPEAERYFNDYFARDKQGKDPAREAAAYSRAAAAYHQGESHAKAIVAAADFFLQKFRQSPNRQDVLFFRAEGAFWLADRATAMDYYKKVPANSPFAEGAHHQIAVCLDLLKRPKEAALAYDAYLEKHPKHKYHKHALERAARLWAQLGQYAKAAERYGAFAAQYAKTEPKKAEEFLFLKGACEHDAQQFDAMYKTFKTYFDRKYKGRTGEVLYFMADYHTRRGQHEAAVPLYELCANMPGPYQRRALYLLAHACNRVGKARLEAKKKEEADKLFGKSAETFLKVIRSAPKELAGPTEYLWTAEIFREQRRCAEAIAAYEALIGRYPKEASATVIYWLGELSRNVEPPDYQRAEKYYRLFLKRFQEDESVISAYFGLAETLKGAGKHKEAWTLYQRVEQLAQHKIKDPEARSSRILLCQLQMGRMAFDDKDYKYARDYLLRVGYLAAGDEAAEALYKAGRAAYELKEIDRAVSIWQRLLRHHRKSKWAEPLIKELARRGLRLAPDGKTIEKKPAAP